jgi:hypothetical protein
MLAVWPLNRNPVRNPSFIVSSRRQPDPKQAIPFCPTMTSCFITTHHTRRLVRRPENMCRPFGARIVSSLAGDCRPRLQIISSLRD